MVSGASAYRDGEFLYQDFLYDDYGAAGTRDPADPRLASHVFSLSAGTYLYPTAAAYANNAADIVEFRVKPLPRATAFRITLNSMSDPSLVASTIAIGDSAEPRAFPHGANVRAPAELFLTVHGSKAELVRAGAPAVPIAEPAARVSVRRRQIEVRVPRSAWDPGRETVRMAMGTGLWEITTGRYLVPGLARSATAPGGAGTLGEAAGFFNVAFRADEPFQNVSALEEVPSLLTDSAWWRERRQAHALANGEISRFHADIDFGALQDGVTDNSAVPKRGPINRIFASRFDVGQGAEYDVDCTAASTGCPGVYQGRLQPYALYIPKGKPPARGWGTTLLLHSLAAGYNQFSGSRNQSQFGDRGRGSVVFTPLSRGPDGSYDSYAGTDVFEVWADVARNYGLDPGWTAIAGYSMGGFGSFKLAEQFPDLFAKAQPTVGGDSGAIENLRHIPVLMWNAVADELVNPALYLPAALALDELGYRYELDQFAPAEHLTLAFNDEYGPAAQFLGTTRVVRNPAHVTYTVDTALDYPGLGFVADHAYWVSDLRPRAGASASIDAFTHAFGEGDPVPTATQTGAGVLSGGSLPGIPFVSMGRSWGETPSLPRRDALALTATNLARATIDMERAGLSCSADVELASDGPIRVRLAGCGRTLRR